MARYAAFLRGINVGGHRVSKGELGAAFEAVGLTDVDTFRASGNLVFAAERGRPPELAAAIEERLADALGYEVRTFIRTAAEIGTIARKRPFPAASVEASDGKLQVLLLPRRPPKAARDRVLGQATDEDRLVFGDRELYWLPSGPMRDAGIDLAAIEREIGPTTMRTKGTVEAIADRYFAAG